MNRTLFQRSARPLERRASAWVTGRLPWLPAILAGGFVVWTLGNFSRILDTVHLNPDSGFAPVLAADRARGGIILVGEASHLGAIGFLWLTRSLPFRDVIWDGAPYVTFLVALALVAWACWQVAGPWAALMTAAVGVCAEATVLLTVMAEGMRGNTFLADAAMCAYLVLMVRCPALERWKKGLATAAAALVAGATVASDPLFLVAGLAPLLLAAGAVWLIVRDRWSGLVALATVGVAGASLAVSWAIWAVAHHAGFRKNYLEGGYSRPGAEQVQENVEVLWRHVRTLTHISSQSLLLVVVLGAALYTVALLVQLGRRAQDAREPALVAYTAFWLLSGLGILAAFALSSFASGPSDTSRYVTPVFLALAAVGPLWGRRADWRRPVAAAGVVAFCLVSISARRDLFYESYPGLEAFRDSGAEVVAYLESEGLTHGYGGYFTSHPFTILSGYKVHVYPVVACQAPVSDTLCPLFVNTRTAWYRPRPGQRSFFIQDGDGSSYLFPPPAAAAGRPASTRTFGTMTVSVYDYDIASRFAPPCMDPGTFLCPPGGPG